MCMNDTVVGTHSESDIENYHIFYWNNAEFACVDKIRLLKCHIYWPTKNNTCFNKYNKIRSVPSLYRLTRHYIYNKNTFNII